ncbi:hypothetical protein JCM11491_005635 [Sporobolomyces phaffii]
MGRGPTIADTTISALSLVGSISILVGFALSSQRHHIRQKVVCALGVMDLIQASDTLAGSINELRGRPYTMNSASCNTSGFFYQFSTFGSACLTLIIAGITFASLAHPLSTVTARLEHRLTFPILMVITFLISFVPAVTLTVIFDLVDVRGVCWFRPNTNASNLTIFVPRAFVLVIVIVLYTRLLIFFQRRDMKLFGTNSMSQTGEGSSGAENDEGTKSASKRFSIVLPRRMSSWTRRSSNGSNAQKSERTVVKGGSAAADPNAPATDSNLLDATTTPSYSPHTLSPIPASPDLGDRSESAAFTNPFPRPQNDWRPSSDYSARKPDLEHGFTSPLSATPNESRRPSDQPSALSHFRIDDTTSRPNDRRATNGTRRVRGQLSPRQVNRRLSVLLMLYPLAYALLIAVSLARLIQQISTRSLPNPTLSNISRWLIYSQGLIDGLLFTVIRWILFNVGRSRS